jgi:hypothetical protein
MNLRLPSSGTDKILVRIDPDLTDLIPGFLSNRRADVALLGDAIAQRDFETIRTVGHRLRGDGGGYGFLDISTIGAALEQAAKNQDLPEIHRQIMALSTYLERVEVVYE